MLRIRLQDREAERRLFTARSLIAIVVVSLLTVTLVGRFAYVEVWRHRYYVALARDNLTRPLPIIPYRGLILDRHGIVLADNYPVFTLGIEPDAVHNLPALLTRLKDLVSIDRHDVRVFDRHLHRRSPYSDIILRHNLSTTEAASIAVHLSSLQGAVLHAQLQRFYPLGGLAVDAVGYVSPRTAAEAARQPRQDRGFIDVGQSGLEKVYQRTLMGRIGWTDVEANARGRMVKVLRRIPPRAGDNLYLTLSAQMQAVAEEMLKNRRGAVVAINPRTGAVLVFVSSPNYNPNRFVHGISRKAYLALLTDPGRPLYDRALNGLYPPGSSIKPFYAYAALQTPWFHPNKRVLCGGTWHIPGNSHLFHDWLPWGMGRIGLQMGLEESSDVYFYKLAYRQGIARMARYLTDFGFGRPTGIDLPGESAGIVPTPGWIKAHDAPWYEGETIITGIGQGPLLVTPLQLADAMAALANHGIRTRPRLVEGVQNPLTQAVRYLQPQSYPPIPHHRPGSLKVLVHDLTTVISGPLGTAHIIAHHLPYAIAGKTGTAQLWSVPRGGTYHGPRLHSDAIFTAMAPVPDPRIVVAVVLEHAGFGARSAIPTEIARALINLDLLGHAHVRNAKAAVIARFSRERYKTSRDQEATQVAGFKMPTRHPVIRTFG